AARIDRAQHGGARARVPAPPRLRHARGRQGRRPRHPAPPHHPHVRGRGRAGDDRGHHPPSVRARRGPMAIPRELLKKIRKIEIFTSKLVNDQLAGQYQSVFKGRGMAFSEVRQYQPGDDVRLIDWNVSARMNEPFVKIFVEEREMTVILLVDMSANGLFGSRAQSKREVAAEVAALVAFSAIKNNDRVGLIIFTDDVELFVPPKKGKKHVLRVISEILTFEPRSPRTDIRAGIDFLGR